MAGYTRRLITKAEASNSLHADTIEILAEALSTPERTVFPEDLISDPIAIGRKLTEIFAQSERQFVHAFQEYLAEDVECLIGVGQSDVPFTGRFYGLDGMDEHIRQYFKMFARPRPLQYFEEATIAHAGHMVFLHTEETVCLLGTSETFTTPIRIVLHIERGKVQRIVSHGDLDRLREYVRLHREGLLLDGGEDCILT